MNLTPRNLQDAELFQQGELSFDPYNLMPPCFPTHPRVLCTKDDIERARGWIKEYSWMHLALDRLLTAAAEPLHWPEALPVPADLKLIAALIEHAERNALAYLLTGEVPHRENAVAALLFLAGAYPGLPISTVGRLTANSLAESRATIHLARAYDLLEAGELDDSDRDLFRAMLTAQYAVLDGQGHRACGNHNTWCLAARVAVASALGDPQGIHEALYGYACPPLPEIPDTPLWCYGLVHQLRHDILADGLHWERTPGYHYYTLMAFVEAALMLHNIGIDLWHLELPSQMESAGHDVHRDYGPEGLKCLQAAFDAPLYLAFANGDLSLLHDSGLASLRGVPIWGIVYEAAYDAYHDPKYAWLLRRIERENSTRSFPGLPMSLQTATGDLDFVRIRTVDYPAGAFSLANDAAISLTGRHTNGCTLFPVAGTAVLRSDAADEKAPGLCLFWGPHSAGHQNPAALHLDIHAGDRFVTATPASGGYEDARHLDWARTTIAHNTVTVDQKPMFPYDLEGDSIWEADYWRHRNSEGQLDLFQIENDFKAVRASNQNVYPGVRLDRTVALTQQYLIDVFRVFSDEEHTYDWAAHGFGRIRQECATRPIDLGNARGYHHLSEAAAIDGDQLITGFTWDGGSGRTRCQIIVPPGGGVILAREPAGVKADIGETLVCPERSCMIVRHQARATVFIAFWHFSHETSPMNLIPLCQAPDEPIELAVETGQSRTLWHFPIQATHVRTAVNPLLDSG